MSPTVPGSAGRLVPDWAQQWVTISTTSPASVVANQDEYNSDTSTTASYFAIFSTLVDTGLSVSLRFLK